MKNLNIPFWIKIILFYCLVILAFVKNANFGTGISEVSVNISKDSLNKIESNLKAENIIISPIKP